VALTGCQFGSDSGNAAFIREADQICQTHERQIALIPQPQTFLRDFAVYMQRAVPIARDQNVQLRKLEAPEDLPATLDAGGIARLPIEFEHAAIAGALPRHHDDPFDRMLVAQAQHEGLTLLTSDARISRYGVATLPAS